MFSSRIFRITFLISVFIHVGILLHSHSFNPFSPAVKKQDIEVSYRVSPRASQLRVFAESKSFPRLDSGSNVGVGSRVPPAYIDRSDTYKPGGIPLNKASVIPKPTFARSELIAIKRKIALPPIEMAKIDNPSYITYYQIVREKIRRCAYQNYTHNETGEAYISFIISNDGSIKDVRMVEDKTTAKDYLKDIALRSVKDASPFPNFPKELDYPQLSFNIIISFEIE